MAMKLKEKHRGRKLNIDSEIISAMQGSLKELLLLLLKKALNFEKERFFFSVNIFLDFL